MRAILCPNCEAPVGELGIVDAALHTASCTAHKAEVARLQAEVADWRERHAHVEANLTQVIGLVDGGQIEMIDAAVARIFGAPSPLVARTVAALQARPDLALQVLEHLRVARSWVEDLDGPEPTYARWDARMPDPDPLAEPTGFVYREPQDGRWNGSCCEVEIDEDFATADEAMAAVDAALSACGWGLCSSPAPTPDSTPGGA